MLCCKIFVTVVFATLCVGLIFVVLFFCITDCSYVLYQWFFVSWVGARSVFVLFKPSIHLVLLSSFVIKLDCLLRISIKKFQLQVNHCKYHSL